MDNEQIYNEGKASADETAGSVVKHAAGLKSVFEAGRKSVHDEAPQKPEPKPAKPKPV